MHVHLDSILGEFQFSVAEQLETDFLRKFPAQAFIGGIGGAVKGIFGPVINIARKVI